METTIRENLVDRSVAIARNENILNAKCPEPIKVQSSTRIGRFIDSCISFIARFKTPSEREIQRAARQKEHKNVKEKLGELYGQTLEDAGFSSHVLSRLVESEYSKFFAEDIEQGNSIAPERVKTFSQNLNTTQSLLRSQIERKAALQKEQSSTHADAAEKPSNFISRLANTTAHFVSSASTSIFHSISGTKNETPDPSSQVKELLKIKALAAQRAQASPTSDAPDSAKIEKPTPTTTITRTASAVTKSSTRSRSLDSTESDPIFGSVSSLTSSLLSLDEALTTLSPGHGLTREQLTELQQGKSVCTLALDERQKEGTRFLPTTTVYQLVNVDPKKYSAEQAAKLFVDPSYTQKLMGSDQCLKTPTKDITGNTCYTLARGTLTAKLEATPLPDNQPGYQVTSSRIDSDFLEKNEGRCSIVPVMVGGKPQLLIIHRTESTLTKNPVLSTFLTSKVNSAKEAQAKSLITNFKGLIEQQTATT